jgi:integrase/recombinase XerD
MAFTRDSEIIELWLTSQPSPHTRSCYQRDIDRLSAFTGKPIGKLKLGDLQRFAQSLAGLAPISRGRTIAAIRSLFRFCQRRRFLPDNPATELVLPRYERRLAERMLGEDQIRGLLETSQSQRNSLLFRTIYAAGLRVSEVCQLRWRNLAPRGESGQITVFGKNGKTRAVLLPADLWSELMSSRNNANGEAPVFPSRSGRHLDRGRVCRILRHAAAQAGISAPVSPHWLRHAHASHALDRGAPIHLVQSTLGHSSVSTTSMYLHARPDDSSSRFLSLTSGNHLHVFGTGVINGVTATAATGESTPMNPEVETSETKSKTTKKKATVRAQARNVAPAKGKARKNATPAPKSPKTRTGTKQEVARKESKTNQLLDLLKRANGATLSELINASGWQPHSVRGFLSGTVGKKLGLTVQSEKNESGERTYIIVS